MRTLRRFFVRFANLFAHRQSDREFDAELGTHLALMQEEFERRGLSSQEAMRQVRMRLGGVEQVRDLHREARTLHWLETLVQDTRFALRILRKNPGFAAVAVLTLALGIGANTAIFSLVNAVLLNSMPVANPHELVLFSDFSAGGSSSGWQTGVWKKFSSDNYANFGEHNQSFKELTAYQTDRTVLSVHIGGAERAEVARSTMVAGNFFSFLGLHAAAGRLLTPEDDRAAAPPVAVLDYGYWTNRFHNDPGAIGQTVEFNGIPFTIVGVAPRGFTGVNTYLTPNLWIPLARQTDAIPGETDATNPHEYWLNIVGRIEPSVKLRQAEAVVTTQLKQSLRAQTNREGMTDRDIAESRIELSRGAGGISYFRGQYAEALEILAVIMGIVLLMACANVANLLLSRSAAREREISVRLAVGASKGRLVRQLLTESVLLALIGGAAGMLAAKWASQMLAVLVTGNTGIARGAVDATVLAYSIGVTVLAGILFGLAPAIGAGRADLATSMKGSLSSRLQLGFPNAIVVFQVAGSIVLLIGAGLFVRTFQKLADQTLGFDEDHILLVGIDARKGGYNPKQTSALYQLLLDRFEAIPGVRSATLENFEPLSGDSWRSNFAIEAKPVSRDPGTLVQRELVGPRYFETEGIPILRGRDIGLEDQPGQPLVTVINEAMARKYFPGENPIGRRFSLGAPFDPGSSLTIVGVAADARYYSLRDPVPPMEFAAALQMPGATTHNSDYEKDIAIRTSGDPQTVMAAIRPAAKEAAPNLPITDVTLIKDVVGRALRQNRTLAELSSGFGMLTLLLACIGLYGTLAYRVSRRTQEIGVRMALGAQRSSVMWLVTREGLYLILPGIVLGVLAALGSTKVIASQLFGVSTNDWVTFAAMALLLLAVALIACWIPARRAMRVDPMVALRHE
ncbi:MAG TPA: ABC transporter permease [Candidatus Acidoferrales bacterium]